MKLKPNTLNNHFIPIIHLSQHTGSLQFASHGRDGLTVPPTV